jgi:hypothetical protein
MFEKSFAGRMCSFVPFGGGGQLDQRVFGLESCGSDNPNELIVAHHENVLVLFAGFHIDRNQFGAVAGRAKQFTVKHPRARNVGRILMRAGDEVCTVRTRHRRSHDFPFRGRSQSNIGGHRLLELFERFGVGGKVSVSQRTLAGRMEESPIAHFQSRGFDIPAGSRKVDE